MRRKDSGDWQQYESYLEPLDPKDVLEDEQEIDMTKKKTEQKNPNAPPKPPSMIAAEAKAAAPRTMTAADLRAKRRREAAEVAAATPKSRFVRAVIATGKRLQKLAAQCGGDGALEDYAAQVFNVAEALGDSLPADWKPVRTRGASKADWKPGTPVQIASGYRKHYDGFLEPAEMGALVLVAVKGKAAIVSVLVDGPKFRVRLHHLAERP